MFAVVLMLTSYVVPFVKPVKVAVVFFVSILVHVDPDAGLSRARYPFEFATASQLIVIEVCVISVARKFAGCANLAFVVIETTLDAGLSVYVVPSPNAVSACIRLCSPSRL